MTNCWPPTSGSARPHAPSPPPGTRTCEPDRRPQRHRRAGGRRDGSQRAAWAGWASGTPSGSQTVSVHQTHQVPLAFLGGAQGGDVHGEIVLCAQATMTVADAQLQGDELLVDRVAGLFGEWLGKAQVDTERVGGTVGPRLVGEGEPLPVMGAGLGSGQPGGVDVLVIEQGVDQDGAAVPALPPLRVSTQQGKGS